MPINATIPLGVQPLQIQQQDPNEGMNALARMMQIRGLQDESKVNALRLQDMQRTTERRNKLDSLLGGFNGKPEELDGALLKGGFLDEAMKVGKDRREALKIEAEAEAKRIETAHKKVDLIGQTLGWVRQNPTLENATAAMQYLARNGAMTPEDVQDKLARFQADPTPQSIASFADMGFRAALQVKDQLPKYDTRNLGGTTQMTAVDPVTGQVRVVNSVQNTQNPDAQLQATTSTENNKRSVGASLANAAATREVAQATRDAANIQTGFKNEQDLRKEFEGLPEVKNYKQAYPAYAAIKDAASRNTTQSDINIVYGLAKLYDPTSVVREGEYATVANSPNIPERVKGYAQYLQGGGKLSPETKRQILAEAQGRIGTYEAEARKARGSYEQIAKTRGMNPSGVFADMGDMTAGAQPPKPSVSAGRESSGKVTQGPSLFDQADAILKGGKR